MLNSSGCPRAVPVTPDSTRKTITPWSDIRIAALLLTYTQEAVGPVANPIQTAKFVPPRFGQAGNQ
jgi:hypothetical protein